MANTLFRICRRRSAVLPNFLASHLIPIERTKFELGGRTLANVRRFSAPSKNFVVINAVGIDRPGIVADVTRVVAEKGGNIGESQAQLLGGHFSVLMHVEISSSELENLRATLQSGIDGVTTSCFDSVDPKAVEVHPTIGWTGRFRLSGVDNPGLVHNLVSIFAKKGITIDKMTTSQKEAPFGGTELFTMDGTVSAYEPLASNFDWAAIQSEVQELGESLNCDADLEEVTRDYCDANLVA